MLANAKWQNVSWRNGTKGRLEARFAAVRVRTADGPPQRIKDKGQQHLPGDEAWLIGEHRTLGREEILSRQSAGQDGSAHVSCHDQSAMDLRTGPSAVERGTRARSLRGTILARPPSSCPHDHDRLRIPPTSPSRTSGAEKKESTVHRLSRACRPYATPSSNSSFDHDLSDARTAEDKSAKSNGVNKSAKVVLGRDEEKCVAVFRPHPALKMWNRSRS